MGEDCILFLMFCSSRARLSCPLFSACQTKKRGEMEREGSWRIGGWVGGWVYVCVGEGGVGEMEGLLTCTCLQSLRMHCTIHLLCLYCHGWGQSDQTPIRYLILPPMHTPTLPPPPPNTFFSCDMLTEGEARQFTSIPKWGNVRKGTHIKTMLSWRYSMVQNLQTRAQPLRMFRVQTHTGLCSPQ